MVNIVRAVLEDAHLISDLSNATFIQTYRGTCSDEDLLQFIDKCFNEEGVLKELIDPENYYFIAFADEFPVGYIRLKEDYIDYPNITRYRALELKRIYVLSEWQSKEVGAGLMQFAIDFAIEKNFEAIWLGVWEENPKAIRFYKRFGFVDTGERHTFYIGNTGQTDRWMIKSLNLKSFNQGSDI